VFRLQPTEPSVGLNQQRHLLMHEVCKRTQIIRKQCVYHSINRDGQMERETAEIDGSWWQSKTHGLLPKVWIECK